MSIDISKLKLTWRGQWQQETRYFKNDVVQWDGKTYLCTQDTPDEHVVTAKSLVGMNVYQLQPQVLKRKSFRPLNKKYWKLLLQSTDKIETWSMWQQYEPGEMCKAHKNIYMCIKRTRIHNTWVEETDYWIKVLEMQSHRAGRHEQVAFANRAPLGWKYNMGSDSITALTNHADAAICSDGTCMIIGGSHSGRLARGYEGSRGDGKSRHTYSGFTFTDWLKSADNSYWNEDAYLPTDDFKGLVTPDGKTPKIIQIAAGTNTALFLMNNGEVYASGYNGHGQLGNSETSDRKFSVRVSATDRLDWLGNPIQKTFNETKIVKVTISGRGTRNGSNSCGAIGEDGSVWVWGYNGNQSLGLGNQDVNADSNYGNASTAIDEEGNTVTVPNTGNGFRTGNQFRPVRLPQSYFGGNKIVDIWAWGSDYASWHALDDKGNLWAWGSNLAGGLGVGGHYFDNYVFTPERVPMDWNAYGGLKKLMHASDRDGNNWKMSVALTNDGNLWIAGYNSGGGVPIGADGADIAHYSGTFVSSDSAIQGTIDEFWFGGDEQKWCIIRQKDTGYTYITDGGNGTPHRSSMTGMMNGYQRGNGMGMNEVNLLEGPMWVQFVDGPWDYRINYDTNNLTYSNPIILDGEWNVWAGGRQEHGYASLGYQDNGQMQDQDWYYGRNSPDQTSDMPWNPYHPRMVLTPSGTRITDIQFFGYGNNPNASFKDSRGKVMWSGTNDTSDSFATWSYHHWTFWYDTFSGAQHQYHHHTMHSGPTD